jgi:hypothetical protein
MMLQMKKPTRYWGVVLFSIAWVFAVLLINAEAGSPSASAITLLWLWVAYSAFRGDAQSIKSISKFAMILQGVVGGGVFLWILNDPNMKLYFGSPIVFLVSLTIPFLAWAILYRWASIKVDTLLNQGTNSLPLKSANNSGEFEITREAMPERVVGSKEAATHARDFSQPQATYKHDERDTVMTKNARIALDHREEFTKEWPKIRTLGENWVRTFIAKLDTKPDFNLIELLESTSLELQETYPFHDEKIASLYSELCDKTQKLTDQADILREFREATFLLCGKIPVEKIYDSVLKKSRIFPIRELVFSDVLGKKRSIEIYRGSVLKTMSAAGVKREFFNLYGLFTYLGKKPKAYRLGEDIIFKELPNSSIVLMEGESQESVTQRYINFEQFVESVDNEIKELKIIS